MISSAPTDVGAEPDSTSTVLSARCPVTVVGIRRRADLMVPLNAPIGEYIGRILELVGQPQTEALPEVWSLAPFDAAPYPLDQRLADHGVLEGAVFYVKDLAADEADEPTVVEIDEAVAAGTDSLGRARWNQHAAAAALVVVGAGWLLATCGLIAASTARRPLGATVISILLGLLVPGVGALIRARRWPVPGGIDLALALCAPAFLAMAGWQLTGEVTTLLVGAFFGALVALAVRTGAVTVVLVLWAGLIATTAVVLSLAQVTPLRSAEIAALGGFLLLALAPTVAWRVAMMHLPDRVDEPLTAADDEMALAATVRRAHLVLGWWAGTAGLITGTALVVLAASDDVEAWMVVGALALACVLRAVSYTFVVEAVAAIVAASAGALTLIVLAPPVGGWSGPGVSLGLGGVLLAIGCWLSRRSPFRDRRPHWLTGLAAICVVTAFLAVLADFGMSTWLMDLGRSMS